MYTLLVEDDQDYADIIAHTLERDGHEVVHFEELGPAIRFSRKKTPQLAILDVVLPDGNGFDGSTQLRQVSPGMAVIFLSSLDRSTDIVAGLEAGGDDYLTKPFHPRELLARTRAVLRRARITRPDPAEAGSEIHAGELSIDTARSRATFRGAELPCTPIEVDILAELARFTGQPLSHAFLTEQVWGYNAVTDATLLKGHMSSIRRKLQAAGAPGELVRTLHGVGYSLDAAAS